jgi:hypothetical protein
MTDLCIGLLGDLGIGQVSNLFLGQVINSLDAYEKPLVRLTQAAFSLSALCKLYAQNTPEYQLRSGSGAMPFSSWTACRLSSSSASLKSSRLATAAKDD